MAHISHATDLFLESKPSVLLAGGNIDLVFSPYRSYVAALHSSTLLLSGMDVQWGIPHIAGGLITASTCRSLTIRPEGPLCNTSVC